MFLYFHSKFQVSVKIQQHFIGPKMLSQNRVKIFTVAIFSTMLSGNGQHLIQNVFLDFIPVNPSVKSIIHCTKNEVLH